MSTSPLTIKGLYPNINPEDNVVFIGLDTRETMAYLVAKHSIERLSPGVKVLPLYTKDLRQAGIYSRTMITEGTTGQYIDELEDRPHSVDFSFTRFLVPHIARELGIKGYTIFCDCDFLFTQDLNPLFSYLNTIFIDAPLAVVKHKFPTYTVNKMDGCSQVSYNNKLWSAFMCFNTQHKDLDSLTPCLVNKASGMNLHQFGWLNGGEGNIVALPERFQFIPGHSQPELNLPFVIHYTEKAPWFVGANNTKGDIYSDLWWDEVELWKQTVSKTPRGSVLWI